MAISIDPRDTPADAAAAKAKYLARYHHPAANAGWHFLTGRQQAVERIAESVGFPYRYDPELDQYLHPAGFALAAPDGVIARYILDLDLQPSDLRAAIADAGEGRAIGPVTRFVLWCRGHGPQLGRYTVPIEAAFVLASTLGGLIFVAVSVATQRRR